MAAPATYLLTTNLTDFTSTVTKLDVDLPPTTPEDGAPPMPRMGVLPPELAAALPESVVADFAHCAAEWDGFDVDRCLVGAAALGLCDITANISHHCGLADIGAGQLSTFPDGARLRDALGSAEHLPGLIVVAPEPLARRMAQRLEAPDTVELVPFTLGDRSCWAAVLKRDGVEQGVLTVWVEDLEGGAEMVAGLRKIAAAGSMFLLAGVQAEAQPGPGDQLLCGWHVRVVERPREPRISRAVKRFVERFEAADQALISLMLQSGYDIFQRGPKQYTPNQLREISKRLCYGLGPVEGPCRVIKRLRNYWRYAINELQLPNAKACLAALDPKFVRQMERKARLRSSVSRIARRLTRAN